MNQMNDKILSCLKTNSRMTWKEIGKRVHLTGQAVATRVKQMEEQNIISRYTICREDLKQHFITVFMESTDFIKFDSFLKKQNKVDQAFKVTGEGCYLVIFCGADDELEEFLNLLLEYGRYRVSSTLKTIK